MLPLHPCHPESTALHTEFDVVPLCDRPRIYLIRDFLAPDECSHLIELARPRVRPALTVNPDDGSLRPEWYRSNALTHLAYFEDSVVADIEQRIARLTGIPTSHGEALQVLRYEPDQQYVPHYDFFPPQKPGVQQYLKTVGQRLATVMVYLNDVDEGGETVFPKVSLKVTPKQGSALVFYSLLSDGTPDLMSLHGGSKVIAGTKWLATKWLHNQVCPIIDENNAVIPTQLAPLAYPSQCFLHDLSTTVIPNNTNSIFF